MITIAGSVGIDQESALAFGLLVHLATLLVTSVGGAIVLIFGHRRPETDEAPAPGNNTTDGEASATPASAEAATTDGRPAG